MTQLFSGTDLGGGSESGALVVEAPTAGTPSQYRELKLHRTACQFLGIPRSRLEHKKLKGTESAVNTHGNQIYTGPGPITNYTAELVEEYMIWWVHQPFVRGEQRIQDEQPGIQATQLEQSQCPAITDDGQVIRIAADDFVIDAQGWYWKVLNPVLSPDMGFWTFMTDRSR